MSKLKYFDGTNWNEVGGNITGDTLPIGAIVPFGGWDAPTGWLICDGTLLNKTAYPELFNAIGYSFGGEEGGSTFGLPDLRGRVPLGLKETDTDFNGMGLTGGNKTHTQTADEVAPHTHQLWIESEQSGSTFGLPQSAMHWDKAKNNWANNQFGVNRTNVNTAQPMNIMNPYQTVNYIIKAKQSAGLIANVSKTYSSSEEDTYACSYENKHFGGVELYSGTTAGDITLSESAANYNVIEIFYKSSDSVYLNTGKIYSPNGKNVGLYAPYSIGTTCYSKQARVNINGTAITMSNEIETQLWASNEKVAINTPSSGNHYFTIEKVIGYK